MTIQKLDPTSITIQNEISTLVWQRVAEKSTYTIPFRGNPITAFSAEGAQELYAQCVQRKLCPQIELKTANDKVVEGNWIVDAVFIATDPQTGEIYTIDARGSEPYSGPETDPLSVVNRKAMGKALRNAHIKAVPLVIREAYLAHIRQETGKDVHMSEEFYDSRRSGEQSPQQPRPARNRRNQTQTQKPAPATNTAPAKESDPYQTIYGHIQTVHGKSPTDSIQDIYAALGGVSAPVFIQNGGTAEGAIELIDAYFAEQSSPTADTERERSPGEVPSSSSDMFNTEEANGESTI